MCRTELKLESELGSSEHMTIHKSAKVVMEVGKGSAVREHKTDRGLRRQIQRKRKIEGQRQKVRWEREINTKIEGKIKEEIYI